MTSFLFFFIPVLIAASPLFGARFIPTHDGEYHIIRFWQYYTMLSGGTWFPRWAPDLNNGLGIPLFTFQYPFPNVIGSVFHFFGLSFVDSVKWTLGTGYIAAILCCYSWMRRLFAPWVAAIAAVTCAFVPYWFIDLYIRGSVGEVWAFVWVFGSLYAISSGKHLLTAITISLLIISHNIMAIIFVPFILLYAGITRSRAVVDTLIGVGISSYFWLPALYEQRFITGLSNVNVFDYFPQVYQLLIPSWGSGFRGQITGGNEMSYQIGIIPLVLAIITGFSVVRRARLLRNETRFAFILFVVSIILMLPVSQYIWKLIPFMGYVQYPWRLLSIVVVVTPILAGEVVSRFRFGWVIAVCAIIFAFGYARPVTYEPRTDRQYLSHESLARGTSSLGNAFQTRWITGVTDGSQAGVSLSSGVVRMKKKAPTIYDIEVSAAKSGTLTLPTAYYPGWKLVTRSETIEGVPNAQGLLTFPIQAGEFEAQIRLGSTSWQIVALVISILSLLTAVVSFILRK